MVTLIAKESISIVQCGIPFLAEYPPDRIEFQAPYQADSDNRVVGDRWGPIMAEAWAIFDKRPPVYLRVQVIDKPGDRAVREEKEAAGE